MVVMAVMMTVAVAPMGRAMPEATSVPVSPAAVPVAPGAMSTTAGAMTSPITAPAETTPTGAGASAAVGLRVPVPRAIEPGGRPKT